MHDVSCFLLPLGFLLIARLISHRPQKFKELSELISEIGNNSNAILDLEERHQQLKVRAGSLDVNQITADLEAIRVENAQLLAQVKDKQDQ